MNAVRGFISPDGVLNWKRAALLWGAFMFLFWQAYRALDGREITLRTVIFDLVLWSVAAVVVWSRLAAFLARRRAKA